MAGSVTEDEDEITGINVTPLVDIVLVLLIIFMVTANFIDRETVEVDLPRAASPSDSLPAFAWTGTHGTAVLANLPAFVRVVYGPEGAARPWSVNRTIDALAIALVAAASTVWIWRTRR